MQKWFLGAGLCLAAAVAVLGSWNRGVAGDVPEEVWVAELAVEGMT